MRYAVFGLGNSTYIDHYNVMGKNCDKFLYKLSAERLLPLHLGKIFRISFHISFHICFVFSFRPIPRINFLFRNECLLFSGDENEDLEEDFNNWKDKLLSAINSNNDGDGSTVLNAAVENVNTVVETDSEESEEEEEEDDEEGAGDDELVDLEDLGSVMKKAKQANENSSKGPKEMLNPTLRKSLTKQGYKLIGSHSGVKICRWTKAMMRGRGGCYKHSFYGIESHRCMETTPSLACKFD